VSIGLHFEVRVYSNWPREKFTMCSERLRLRNDLYCVQWGVKLYSVTHS